MGQTLREYHYESYACGSLGEIVAEAFLLYDPADSYLVEGWAEYSLPDLPSGRFYDGEGLGGFQELFDLGQSMYAPWELTFFGTGDAQEVSFSTITLAFVNAFIAEFQTQRSNDPVGLKVVDDDTNDVDCNRKERVVRYQMVDAQGRPVGKKIVSEKFDKITNVTCVEPSSDLERGCFLSISGGKAEHNYSDDKGRTRDRLRAKCEGDSPDCGFTIDKQRLRVSVDPKFDQSMQ